MAQQQDMATNVGNAILNLLSGAAKPFINTAKMGLGAGYEGARAIDYNLLGNKNAYSPQAPKNPFLTEQQMNPSNIVKNTGQDVLNILSYGVPFGKGANFLTKAILPGLGVGALAGAAQDNASPQSILGNAALGAGGAGALHGLTSIPGLFGKAGNALEGVGGALRQGVNKIEVPASIYGASKEKAINKTLDLLGISGNPAQKYEQLLPKYQGLSDQIESTLANNPKTIARDTITNDLMTNLNHDTSLNLSGKPAKQAVSRFLESIAPQISNGESTIPTQVSTADLFRVKQGINSGFGDIIKKIQNGTPLTDAEKVISIARKTIDDLIANAHPNIKQATTMQSHLYDAADSLANSRNAKPTIGGFGFTLPSGVAQQGQDLLGKALQNTGKPFQAGNQINSALNNPILQQILGQGGARLGMAAGAQQSVPNNNNQNGQPGNPIGGQFQQGLGGPNQNQNNVGPNGFGNSHNDSLSQNVNGQQITPKMVSAAYLIFPKIKADKIKEAYDAQFAQGKAPDQINASNAQDGLRGLSTLESTLQSDPNVLLKKLAPGPVAGKYKAAETQLLTNFVYLKTGKQVNPSELKNLQQLLPQAGDSKDTIDYKLSIFKNFYQQVASGQ